MLCLRQIRELQDHKGSTAFMMASTKKIQAALGRTPEEEHRTGSHKLVPHLRGFAGLMFTNLPRAEVETIVREFEHEDYARAGSRATETVRNCSCASASWHAYQAPVQGREWLYECHNHLSIKMVLVPPITCRGTLRAMRTLYPLGLACAQTDMAVSEMTERTLYVLLAQRHQILCPGCRCSCQKGRCKAHTVSHSRTPWSTACALTACPRSSTRASSN